MTPHTTDRHWRRDSLAVWPAFAHYLPGAGFCLAFAIAFIVMSGIVRHDGPALATLMTYGMTSAFFIAIGLRRAPNWINSAGRDARGLFLINGLTIANTFLVYVILLNVSAFTYVLVFFGTLPACVAVLRKCLGKADSWRFTHVGLAGGIGLAACVSSQTSLSASLTGVGLSIVSAIAGASYLDVSKDFQIKTNLGTSDILALRFIGTIIFAGALVFQEPARPVLTLGAWLTYAFIALIGSVIPLYLLQKSNEWIGPERTARLMPLIPLLCAFLSFVAAPVAPSLADLAIVTAATIAMLIAVHRPTNGRKGD